MQSSIYYTALLCSPVRDYEDRPVAKTQLFYLVVPDLGNPIISARYQVWLVTPTVVVNTVNPFLMSLQGEIWGA